MASLKDIKRRISSVKSTQQITKAMKMVAAAKLRKSQERLLSARPYAEGLAKVLSHVAAQTKSDVNPLLEEREVKNICYLIISSDRGLCGSFNANVNRTAKTEIDNTDESIGVKSVVFGRKAFEFFSRRQYEIEEKYINLLNTLEFTDAVEVSRLLQKLYLEKKVDRVMMVYNCFKSAGTQITTIDQLLPVKPEAAEVESQYQPADFIFEPSAKELLDEIVPKNLNIQIWRALLESSASEHGARMVAMESATENAEEMIRGLTLKYNKARQAAITTEISEIVGGAEALQG